MSADSAQPTFFRDAAELRRWFAKHHSSAAVLWIGLHHQASGRGGVRYHEALDEALCQGWIDGLRKKCGPQASMIRFTRRRPGSHWSVVNVARAQALIAAGRMRAAGRRAFEARDPARTRAYSFENPPQEFSAALARRFRAQRAAWAHFAAQPPGYRRRLVHWIMSAKREETRIRRLAQLIAASAAGRRMR